MNNTGNFGGFSNGGIEGGNNAWNVPQENKPVETNQAEAAPAEAPNPLVEQRTESQEVLEVPRGDAAPVTFEDQFAAVTEELPKVSEMPEEESVAAAAEEVKEEPVEAPSQSAAQGEDEFSYSKSLEDDRAALKEAHEKNPDNAKIEGYLAEIEGYIAKVREELKGEVHSIEGDPSSRAERFDAKAYNASVEQKMGQQMYGDDRSGLVSSRPGNLNSNWRNPEQ